MQYNLSVILIAQVVAYLTERHGHMKGQEMRGSAARAEDFPPSTEAAQLYAGDMGSTLTADSIFGRDPFQSEVARW